MQKKKPENFSFVAQFPFLLRRLISQSFFLCFNKNTIWCKRAKHKEYFRSGAECFMLFPRMKLSSPFHSCRLQSFTLLGRHKLQTERASQSSEKIERKFLLEFFFINCTRRVSKARAAKPAKLGQPHESGRVKRVKSALFFIYIFHMIKNIKNFFLGRFSQLTFILFPL